LVLSPHFVGLFHYVVQIRIKNQLLVTLLDSESEASLFFRQRAPQESLRLPLGDNVFLDDGNNVVGVGDAIIVREAKGDGTGVERMGEAEVAADDGDEGAEIELDGVVELVGVDAVDLGDVEVAVGGEPVGDPV